jgi:hypothetical protein
LLLQPDPLRVTGHVLEDGGGHRGALGIQAGGDLLGHPFEAALDGPHDLTHVFEEDLGPGLGKAGHIRVFLVLLGRLCPRRGVLALVRVLRAPAASGLVFACNPVVGAGRRRAGSEEAGGDAPEVVEDLFPGQAGALGQPQADELLVLEFGVPGLPGAQGGRKETPAGFSRQAIGASLTGLEEWL